MFDWSRHIENSGNIKAKTLSNAIAIYMIRECELEVEILNDFQMTVSAGKDSELIIDIEQVLSLVNACREYKRYEVIKKWIAAWHNSKNGDVVFVNNENVILIARPVDQLMETQLSPKKAGVTLDESKGFIAIDDHLSLVVCAKIGNDALIGVTEQKDLTPWLEKGRANLSLVLNNEFQMGLAKDNNIPFIVHFHTHEPDLFISLPLSEPHAKMLAEKLAIEVSSLCFYFDISESIGLAFNMENDKAKAHLKNLADNSGDEFRLYSLSSNGLLKPYSNLAKLH